MVSVTRLKQLAQARGTPLFVIDHDALRRNYREFRRHLPRAQDRVAQTQGFFLPDIRHIDQIGNLPHDLQQILLLSRIEQILQLETDVEVVFNGRLAASGDYDDVPDPGVNRLFDPVLDDRLVDKRQHLFRLRLGGRQETGTQTGGRKNCFANFRCWHRLFILPGGRQIRNSPEKMRTEVKPLQVWFRRARVVWYV